VEHVFTKLLMTLVMVAIATSAGMWMSGYEDDQQGGRPTLNRLLFYWLVTIVISFELAAGAVWDLLRIEYVRVMLAHLGYPLYLLTILWVWRIPGALTLLVPRFPRLKEWAYAGAFFNYTSAAASHFLLGDRANYWVVPLVFALLTLISWRLRPPSRRLPENHVMKTKPALWAVPALVVTMMLVVAYLTLPTGGMLPQ
jgi:hypothetical protein